MSHAAIPYEPLAVLLNKENDFTFSIPVLRPPIVGYKTVKIIGPENLLLSTNFTRSGYLLNVNNPTGNVIEGIVSPSRYIEYELYSDQIISLSIQLISRDQIKDSDSIPLALLFMKD